MLRQKESCSHPDVASTRVACLRGDYVHFVVLGHRANEQALRDRSMLKQDSEARRLGDLSEGDAFIDQHDRNVFADGIENLLVRAN